MPSSVSTDPPVTVSDQRHFPLIFAIRLGKNRLPRMLIQMAISSTSPVTIGVTERAHADQRQAVGDQPGEDGTDQGAHDRASPAEEVGAADDHSGNDRQFQSLMAEFAEPEPSRAAIRTPATPAARPEQASAHIYRTWC